VLITGSNSGIGLNGATKLATRGDHVYLACRTLAKAQAAKDAILKEAPSVDPANIVPLECDLASLQSVRACAKEVQKLGIPLDVLVLNAGVQYSGNKEVLRTADGFEITVGTNHLGHFLLANLLLPQVKAAGSSARVVVTASEVHDPASPGGSVGNGATLGDLSGLEQHPNGDFVMIDGGAYDADKAYKDSKLCNILFARELQRRLTAEGSPVRVVSFGPGLITRTGFFRHQPAFFTALFDFATNDIFRVAETVSGGGDCLTYATEADLPGGVYLNNGLNGFGGHKFEITDTSIESQDDAKAAKLWVLSAGLVGLNA
jgi:protochlorophyllide reductase